MRQLPPSIMEKINKQNQTIYENANPKMNVAIARAKTTVMDSTYWTVETIREKAGLGDVSLAARRFKVTGSPNRIYEIHVDNGIVGTSIREYPDKLKDGWIDQFTLGAGSNVAIAFNGHWERYRKLWRLVTDEKPQILWVDGAGKLQTQLWDDATSKQELASSVKYVRALRGWKNVNFIDKDQGIIAGYIKLDGTVWYRNYCSQLDGTSTWENERQLVEFTGVAVSLNLFITNDYRMGFLIEDSLGKVHWYITDRNWAGMAIAIDTISAAPISLEVGLRRIEYINPLGLDEHITSAPTELFSLSRYTLTDNKFAEVYNIPTTSLNELGEEYEDWGKEIIFRTKHRLFNLHAGDFEVIGSRGSYYPQEIEEIIEEIGFDGKLYKIKFLDINSFNNAGDNPTIRYNTGITTNGINLPYDTFELDFIAMNLVPTTLPIPEVEVIFNE
ncbi:MAG: hypothetical protein RBR71_03480 [Gudongella sp.]|nr:hypothetical protein [Gudongella sp.]